MLGYTFGYLDLVSVFPFFGKTQFEVLCVLASLALAITLTISCLTVMEPNPAVWGPPDKSGAGVVTFLKQTFRSIRVLHPQVRKVCQVQLANWMAWFPFLYYITTFIGQLYVNPFLEENQKHGGTDLSDGDIDRIWSEGTRIGTFALLIYALSSLASNIILPVLIVPTYKGDGDDAPSYPALTPVSPIATRPRTPGMGKGPKTPGGRPALPFTYSAASLSYFPQVSKRRPWVTRVMEKVQIPGLTLRRLWIMSQILFALCMFSTFFIHTAMLASIMTALVGIAWSVTLWAPFALISAEIAKSAERRRKAYRKKLTERANDPTRTSPVKADDDNTEAEEADEVTSQAGIILGLHNVAISAPQLVATLLSSAVFKATQKPRGTPGDDSVGWVLRLSGIAALVAAYLTSRLSEQNAAKDEDEDDPLNDDVDDDDEEDVDED